METRTDLASWALGLILKSVVQAAKWTATSKSHAIIAIVQSSVDDGQKEVVFLREKVARLEDLVSILQNRLAAQKPHAHVTTKLRIQVLRHIELFKIPARKAQEYFCIARSTIYRWQRDLRHVEKKQREPATKTPFDIVRLVWEIFGFNEKSGRLRIAQQLALLNIFLSASAVRNILNRPKPRQGKAKPRSAPNTARRPELRPIAAQHPNDVWSADLTTVKTWGFRPTHVLAVIDHFSRRVVAILPLKRPDAETVSSAMERAFIADGPPARLITDEGSVFTAGQCAAFLKTWNVSHEIGALGLSNSIAVTERHFLTLKSEWLRRVIWIRGIDHLEALCTSFREWFNEFRPHQRLGGAPPCDIHQAALSGTPARPPSPRTAKSVPANIERVHFAETSTTAWRLRRAA